MSWEWMEFHLSLPPPPTDFRDQTLTSLIEKFAAGLEIQKLISGKHKEPRFSVIRHGETNTQRISKMPGFYYHSYIATVWMKILGHGLLQQCNTIKLIIVQVNTNKIVQ